MRISKNKVIQWAEQFDEISNQLSEIYNSINQAETECSEITHLQSDIYHSINDDESEGYELEGYEIKEICDRIDRHSQDTIDEIGNAQYVYNDKCNGINKKLDSLYEEFDDLLKPSIFIRFYESARRYARRLLSFRISLKIVRK